MYRGCQGTWSELRRRKKEEDMLMAEVWWACTLGRKMLFQRLLQQLWHREGFGCGNGPETSVSAAWESWENTESMCPVQDSDGCPSAQGKSGTNLQEVFQPLGPAEGEGRWARPATPNACMEVFQGSEEMLPSSWGQKPVCYSWINPACGHSEVTGL